MLTPEQEKNVAEWVKALRSGEFKQTTRALEDAGGNCCLGVLCRLYERSVGGLHIESYDRTRVKFDGEVSVPPRRVREWVGLRDMAGCFEGDGLAHLNDAGSTFSEIADLIESRPPGLFV